MVPSAERWTTQAPGEAPERPLDPSRCPKAVLLAVLAAALGASAGGAHPPESVWRPSGGARSGRGWWPLAGSRTPCPRSSGQGETLRHRGHRVQENKKWSSALVWIQALGPGQPGRCCAGGWGLRVGGQCWPKPGQRALDTRGWGTASGAAARREQTLPRTCTGQGHPAVLLLVRGALVGSRRGDGKGRRRRQGAAGAVQFPTRGHDDPVVVGEEGELCGGDGTDPQPSLGCQRTGSPHRSSPRQPARPHGPGA